MSISSLASPACDGLVVVVCRADAPGIHRPLRRTHRAGGTTGSFRAPSPYPAALTALTALDIVHHGLRAHGHGAASTTRGSS